MTQWEDGSAEQAIYTGGWVCRTGYNTGGWVWRTGNNTGRMGLENRHWRLVLENRL